MSEDLKPWLRRVARASITDEDVHRDPVQAFNIAFAATRAAYLARAAPVDATPRKAEGFEARRAGSAVTAKPAGAQGPDA